MTRKTLKAMELSIDAIENNGRRAWELPPAGEEPGVCRSGEPDSLIFIRSAPPWLLQNVFEAAEVKGLTVAECEYILTYVFESDTFLKIYFPMILMLPD
jgi:hypothetical protein